MKWRIVGFDHPRKEASILYVQNLTDEQLLEWIRHGIKKGCNLFSIRGFDV